MKEILKYGEEAILINFKQEISYKTHHIVRSFYKAVIKNQLRGIKSIVPAYCSIMVAYDETIISYKALKNEMIKLWSSLTLDDDTNIKTYHIPVCYDEKFGLDLSEISIQKKMSIDEIITIHSQQTYHIYTIGFMPGFPYLGKLDPRLELPRKETPRLQVLAGSVAIAANQTGIYPCDSPGGWNIIGKTPINLFSPIHSYSMSIGDRVKFKVITLTEFEEIKQQNRNLNSCL